MAFHLYTMGQKNILIAMLSVLSILILAEVMSSVCNILTVLGDGFSIWTFTRYNCNIIGLNEAFDLLFFNVYAYRTAECSGLDCCAY